MAMSMRFDEVIATGERLREVSKVPSFRARNKVIDHVDEISRRFIAACPFVIVASRGEDGHIDVSPKGDPAGFVSVLDEKTLAIPDRPGMLGPDGKAIAPTASRACSGRAASPRSRLAIPGLRRTGQALRASGHAARDADA